MAPMVPETDPMYKGGGLRTLPAGGLGGG